ncbi:hypothetical protein AB1N83_003641 [Pleurotus pulmonarius]
MRTAPQSQRIERSGETKTKKEKQKTKTTDLVSRSLYSLAHGPAAEPSNPEAYTPHRTRPAHIRERRHARTRVRALPVSHYAFPLRVSFAFALFSLSLLVSFSPRLFLFLSRLLVSPPLVYVHPRLPSSLPSSFSTP